MFRRAVRHERWSVAASSLMLLDVGSDGGRLRTWWPVRHGPHRADTCAACLVPSIRTVRPAPVTDSPAFQPLHSIPLPLRRLRLRSITFRSLQTVETAKDKSGAPEKTTNPARTSSLRSSRGSNLRYTPVRAD